MRLRARALLLVLPLLAAAACIAAGARADSAPAGWQTAALELGPAWQVTTGAPTAVVAVVDSGVQPDHPPLAGHVLPGYDFVNADRDAADDNGHGTATAGIVLSVCPGCRILPVKVLDANRTGAWTTIATGIRWAADHGAQVINLSVGAPRAIAVVGDAVAYALAHGVIVVAAAGNDGVDETFYPADYPGVVAVAGVDANGNRYPWSDFGASVTVAAPGCADVAALGGGTRTDFCGTSTAAPFVAGLAGLARSYRPTLTPAAFAAALTGSSTPDGGGPVADANRLLEALGAPASAPVSLAPPRLRAAAAVGRTLAADPGRWQHADRLAYAWQCGRGGRFRTLATGRSFTPAAAARGCMLRLAVTAANDRGTVTALSAPVTVRASAMPRGR